MNETSRKDHPDLHKINDWPLYCPQGGRINFLIREVTLKCGMRSHEVEMLIVFALITQREITKVFGKLEELASS